MESAHSHGGESDTHAAVHTSFTQTIEYEDHFKKCIITGHSLQYIVCMFSSFALRQRVKISLKLTFHMYIRIKNLYSIHVRAEVCVHVFMCVCEIPLAGGCNLYP